MTEGDRQPVSFALSLTLLQPPQMNIVGVFCQAINRVQAPLNLVYIC